MLISYKWLQDYVDVDISPEELAEKITQAGIEVEKVRYLGDNLEGVVTGQITAIGKHPNADKLSVTEVTIGDDDTLQIICGAQNIEVGQVVPVALVGAKLPGGMAIRKAKLRGIESSGMICSGKELGIDENMLSPEQREGILVLPEGTPLNWDIKDVLGLDDAVLEADLTPNRGDCLSIIGVAREVAAILKKELRLPGSKDYDLYESIDDRVKIDIEDSELCRRYVARLVKNVKIVASPLWMQQRLRASGIRPINNIVDVTNFVMLEFGQPLHAFDYDTLTDHHIIVRRAKKGETIESLDGIKRNLDENMLVIADPAGPVAIAGVMGGLATEITEKSANVLIESAYFDPINTRKTAQRLGLHSEASTRFEKTIDLKGCPRAATRAAELICEISGGELVGGAVDNYPSPLIEKTIALRPGRVSYILGKEIPVVKIKEILTDLQFTVEERNDELLVKVPSFRPDVSLEEDLIEEVARMYGYNNIPETLPFGNTTRGTRTGKQQFLAQVREILTSSGLNEVITYTFGHPRVLDQIDLPENSPLRNVVKIMNPLSEEQSVMRTLLFPELLKALQRNHNRQNLDMAIFEIGNVFYPEAGRRLPREKMTLSGAAMGVTPAGWNRPPADMDFYFMKGILGNLMEAVGVRGEHFEAEEDNPSFHPGRTAVIKVGEREIGILGEIHPNVLENIELDARVIAFELDIEALLEITDTGRTFKILPRFPSVERDLAVVVSKEVLAGDVVSAIRQTGSEFMEKVDLFDVYTGKQVPDNCKSLAFSLKFQAEDRTLTDAEINKIMEGITELLEQRFKAELRS
ncbi:MAG TPA: phenylalanine--tRNA ligase subunit beta [Clostridia bacterium]|nr:phenylalanine--tRNA ligase subunit beta [Clostridia bacterium]